MHKMLKLGDDVNLHLVDEEFSEDYIEGFKAAMDQVCSGLKNIALGAERDPDQTKYAGLTVHDTLKVAWECLCESSYPGSDIVETNDKQEAEWLAAHSNQGASDAVN